MDRDDATSKQGPEEKGRDCQTPLTFGPFPFGRVSPPCPFSPCAFSSLSAFTALPQPPSGGKRANGSRSFSRL